MGAVGALVFTEAMPFSMLVLEEYISLLPRVLGDTYVFPHERYGKKGILFNLNCTKYV